MFAPTGSATHTGQEVSITRVFDAPVRKVWEAWTTPRGFSAWFGTPPYSTPLDRVSLDVRAGGAWSATQVSEIDGSELPFVGHFLDVREPELLVLTFEDPDDAGNSDVETATVWLVSLDGQTEMSFHQKGYLPEEQYGLLEKGYSLFFDRMQEYVEQGQGTT